MAKWPLCLIAGKVRHVRVDGPGDELSCEYYTRDCGIPKFAPSPKTCGGCSVHKLSLRAEAWKADAERLAGVLSKALRCLTQHGLSGRPPHGVDVPVDGSGMAREIEAALAEHEKLKREMEV